MKNQTFLEKIRCYSRLKTKLTQSPRKLPHSLSPYPESDISVRGELSAPSCFLLTSLPSLRLIFRPQHPVGGEIMAFIKFPALTRKSSIGQWVSCRIDHFSSFHLLRSSSFIVFSPSSFSIAFFPSFSSSFDYSYNFRFFDLDEVDYRTKVQVQQQW